MKVDSRKFTGSVAALLLAITLLLNACGTITDSSTTVLNTPTARSGGIEDSLTQIASVSSPKASSPKAVSVTTRLPETTVTVVVAPTPTVESKPPVPPESSALIKVSPAPIPPSTPTPVAKGSLEKLDQAAELKVIKNGYDAIYHNLYHEPDMAELAQAGLVEVANVTGAAIPAVAFGKDVDQNWNTFSQAFGKMLDSAKNFTYPKYQLAHRVVNIMAQRIDDEHTYFLDTSAYQERQKLLQGDNSSTGFGIVVTTQDNKAYVTRVVSGGPAEQGGIKPGDQLLQYDNQQLTAANWPMIRDAQENETHRFILARPGETKPITVSITKKKYSLPTVEYRMINGHIGYIAIRDFFTNVADETDRAMTELSKQGANSWVLDVRDNPGGVSVEQVVGRFVQGGEVMGYTVDRKQRQPVKVSNELVGGANNGRPMSPQLPLALLMNEGSASSSEILALAVHEFQLGPLIGGKTAGALGHTQAYELGDGTAISVSVDMYESRNGEKLNGIGVSPDIEVKMSVQDLVTGRDPQLKAATDYLEKFLAKR
jgi:carboxyl-terminal processing protease